MKKYTLPLIITVTATILSITMLAIFGAKQQKLQEQETTEQYEKLGYYNTNIQLNKERAKKIADYGGAAATPLLVTSIGAFAYWIPELYEINKQKNKPKKKDFQMNLTGLEEQWNKLDQNKQCGIYAKVYKFIKEELNKNENTTKQQN